MASVRKAGVELGGVKLAATSPITWRLQSGVAPYQTTITVHKDSADAVVALMGSPQTLTTVSANDTPATISDVWVLREAPADSESRRSFVLSDLRWRWSYPLIAREFNIIRKTGERNFVGDRFPIATRVSVDEYDFLPHTIKGDGTRWTAREALASVLGELTGGRFDITGSGYSASLQGVTLRDPGDAALSRLLGWLPGLDVFIRADGVAEVYDTTDTGRMRSYIESLPDATWEGEIVTWIDRKHTRPSSVRVHYTREVEVPFSYSDDYSSQTTSGPATTAPYLENVLPTVDPETRLTTFDPGTGVREAVQVPPGTWMPVKEWLEAMDDDRPSASMPWDFETISRYWVAGDLEGVLGGRELDDRERANVMSRIGALRQHFRQTFRINPLYMPRIRSLRAIRVGILDPLTGARGGASVWGQACLVPSAKGQRVVKRGPEVEGSLYINVDYLNGYDAGEPLLETEPSPVEVQIIDEALGIFRVNWLASPYGTESMYYPSLLVDDAGRTASPVRDMAMQEDAPLLRDAQLESTTLGLFLSDRMRMKAVLTIVPSAPNNLRQFHRVSLSSSTIAGAFNSSLSITGGIGPTLDLYVSPSEETARWAIDDLDQANSTIPQLLGLDGPGLDPGADLPGYVLTNNGDAIPGQGDTGRHLEAHALATAAEAMVAFNDSLQGTHVTEIPSSAPITLTGNMSATGIQIGQAPSAKTSAIFAFPGQSRPTSRFALLPESSRVQVLGTLPFRS